MYFIWVNEPNIKDLTTFADHDLHSAYNRVQKDIIRIIACNELNN